MPWSILQQKHVNATIIEACPVMDLIAVVTTNKELIIYRTISWQRILHIKSTDLNFSITTIQWCPDGKRLAVGGNQGQILIYNIESGEVINELELFHYQENCKIITMHWYQSTSINADQRQIPALQPFEIAENVFFDRSSCFFTLPNKTSRHTNSSIASSDGDTHNDFPTRDFIDILITADEKSRLCIWWGGRVLFAVIPLEQYMYQTYTVDDESKVDNNIRVDSLTIMNNASQLIVVLKNQHNSVENTFKYRLMTLHTQVFEQSSEEIQFLCSTIGHTQQLLAQLAQAVKIMSTEWKLATRTFNMKLDLLKPLFDKYNSQELPQEAMLSTIASGIYSPVLAQYFAQDIQELSVQRIFKSFTTGAQKILSLANSTCQIDLKQLVFHFSELYGRVACMPSVYEDVLGLKGMFFEEILFCIQQLSVEMEKLARTVQETEQDLGLLLQFFLQQIQINTNTKTASFNGNGSINRSNLYYNKSKSLLNETRLCQLLQRAISSAKNDTLYESQDGKNHRSIGNTFMYTLSQMLETSSGSKNTILSHVSSLEQQWERMLVATTERAGNIFKCIPSGTFCLPSSTLDLRVHTVLSVPTQQFVTKQDTMPSCHQRWQGLIEIKSTKSNYGSVNVLMISLLSQNADLTNRLFLLRGSPRISSSLTLGTEYSMEWEITDAYILQAMESCNTSDIHGVSFYTGKWSKNEFDGLYGLRHELLAILTNSPDIVENQSQKESKAMSYIVSYNQMKFYQLPLSQLHEKLLLPNTLIIPSNTIYGNACIPYMYSQDRKVEYGDLSSSPPPIVANGDRQILCVFSPLNSYLSIVDVEV